MIRMIMLSIVNLFLQTKTMIRIRTVFKCIHQIQKRHHSFVGLPFKISHSDAENICKANQSVFEQKSNTHNNLIITKNMKSNDQVKECYIPFYSACIKSVESTFSGQYGIERQETVTRYVIVNKVVVPREEIETVTDWYDVTGKLDPVDYPFGRIETQVYAGFAFPKKHIEPLMRKQEVAQAEQLTDRELLIDHGDKYRKPEQRIIYPHDMASSMATQKMLENIESLEHQRAEQYVKNKYNADRARIDKINVNHAGSELVLKSYHLPAYVKTVVQDNDIINYKVVDGYTGQYCGDIAFSASRLFFVGGTIGAGIGIIPAIAITGNVPGLAAIVSMLISRMALSGIISGFSSSFLGKYLQRYRRKSTESQIQQSIEQNKLFPTSEEDMIRCREVEEFNKTNLDYDHRFKYFDKN